MTAREIAIAALEIAPAQREGYLEELCGDDPALIDAVRIMLEVEQGKGAAALDPDSTITVRSKPSEAGQLGSIGPYKLLRKLGEGGMGVVYHAEQSQPIRRDVALKVIKPGMDTQEVISRFESERQALAMMDHPNIARVIDAGTTVDGRPYFVMELVDGVPITIYSDSRRLSVRERIELFIDVCHAIQHAHQKGIIHRDIKPSNVLVRQIENHAAPKVIDFGLAKAMGQHLGDAAMLTKFGGVVGTLNYMSPEQAELGRQDIDTRSDVYSLGATLYELLTDSLPLDAALAPNRSYVEALKRIVEEDPKPPSARLRPPAAMIEIASRRKSDAKQLPKLVAGELDWIVMKALEKDRSRRYETVNGLARDLRRYLEGEPVEAGPQSTAYRMSKFVRKHRLTFATAAAFVFLLIAGIGVTTWMAVRATRAEQESRAVSEFLRNDLLAQASANNQARPGTKTDPNITVRTVLDRAATRIGGKFGEQPLVEASIRQTIGAAYTDLGIYPDAERQVERALSLRRLALGEGHRDTLASMDALGRLYYFEGKLEQAKSLLDQILKLQNRTLGDDNPETLKSRNSLAVVLMEQGKHAEAEKLYSEVLAAQRRAGGEENPATLSTMFNLATVCVRQRKYAAAEPLFGKVLEVRRRELGEEHPNTLNVMNGLAVVYEGQGRHAEAEVIYTKTMETRLRILGAEHPDALMSMNNLAVALRRQGKYSQAEPLFERALASRRRVLGEEHPRTLISMNDLGILYERTGRLAQAGANFAKVLSVRRRALGALHPDTVSVWTSLIRVLLRERQWTKAEAELREILRAQEPTASETGQRHNYQALLGKSLAGQRRFVEAEPLLLAGYQGMIQRRAKAPADATSEFEETGQWIVELYQGWGKLDKAAEWKRKVLKTEPSQ